MPSEALPLQNRLPAPPPLHFREVNANVFSVHLADGNHVGNLKRIGAVWKFKAVGYEADGAVVPGGGPFTAQHNMSFDGPDVLAFNSRLSFVPNPTPQPP